MGDAARVLVLAAIGAVFGVAIGYIAFDNSISFISVNFSDWLTHNYFLGGRDDAILWGILGAALGGLLGVLHR